MTSSKKLLIVVAVQFLILLSVIGFKQYTVWTSDTILLKTTPVDPRSLVGGDYQALRYEISTIDRSKFVDGELFPGDEVFVELQKGADGYWGVVAVHENHERSYGGTVLLKARVETYPYSSSAPVTMHYGIEQVFVPEASGGSLPSGTGHTVAVQVRVDRFGHATPLTFFVDGQPFDLKRQ
jgi:uncharacterized membrane-anchored protein